MTTGLSNQVRSAQASIHPELDAVLEKHFTTQWLQPLHRPSVEAFDQTGSLLDPASLQNRLILDSGCGTGDSTRLLADRYPDCLVLGIDRSIHRLGKTGHDHFPCREGNIIWLQSELETFWRLALENHWKPLRNFLLYPNPYPKRSQFRKRWHAHPVFPALMALGGKLELRCNWMIYAQEFAAAAGFATGAAISAQPFEPEFPLSPFERKYSASGHALYRVITDLDVVRKNSSY